MPNASLLTWQLVLREQESIEAIVLGICDIQQFKVRSMHSTIALERR